MAGTLVLVRPPYRGLILTTNLHPVRHEPRARLGNIGWLRAAGLAGLVAGAMSMAAAAGVGRLFGTAA